LQKKKKINTPARSAAVAAHPGKGEHWCKHLSGHRSRPSSDPAPILCDAAYMLTQLNSSAATDDRSLTSTGATMVGGDGMKP